MSASHYFLIIISLTITNVNALTEVYNCNFNALPYGLCNYEAGNEWTNEIHPRDPVHVLVTRNDTARLRVAEEGFITETSCLTVEYKLGDDVSLVIRQGRAIISQSPRGPSTGWERERIFLTEGFGNLVFNVIYMGDNVDDSVKIYIKEIHVSEGACDAVTAPTRLPPTMAPNFVEVNHQCRWSVQRVPTYLTCDGVNDCNSGSDEDFTMCGGIFCRGAGIKCDNTCLPHTRTCDGIQDCRNGVDEDPRLCDGRACWNPPYCTGHGLCELSQNSVLRGCTCYHGFTGKRCSNGTNPMPYEDLRVQAHGTAWGMIVAIGILTVIIIAALIFGIYKCVA